MNPLDLRGPEFLLFYLVYGVLVLGLAGLLRRYWTRGAASDGQRRWHPGTYPQPVDAYGIALLRGGRKETIRTLVGKLVVTGAVALERGEVRKAAGSAEALTHLTALERTVLDGFHSTETARGAEKFAEQLVAPQLAELEADLERQGLIPGPGVRQRIWALCGAALVAVPGLGVAKLLVALSRGRLNVEFLGGLIAVYTSAILRLLRPPRQTATGRRYLAWLRSSHHGLQNRILSGRREDAGEATLVAAIFGIGVLPAMADLRLALQPRRRDKERTAADTDGGGDDCGGAFFSSGDGGSSCGGGDGGDGCGGCGGE